MSSAEWLGFLSGLFLNMSNIYVVKFEQLAWCFAVCNNFQALKMCFIVFL